MLSGTLPPFSATLAITALCKAMFCSALPCAGIYVQFLGELFSRIEARIEIEQLQEVHDRLAIIASAPSFSAICESTASISTFCNDPPDAPC